MTKFFLTVLFFLATSYGTASCFAADMLASLLSKNALPDNFALNYDYRELKNGKWETQELGKILWDFKGQRAKVLSIGAQEWDPSGKKMTFTRWSIIDGKDILTSNSVERTKDNFNIAFFSNPAEEIKNRSKPDSYIQAANLTGNQNLYVLLFYGNTFTPYPKIITDDTDAKNLELKETKDAQGNDVIDVVVDRPVNGLVRYIFDARTGQIKSKLTFHRLHQKDGTMSEMRLGISWHVTKVRQVEGFCIPAEIEGEIEQITPLEIEGFTVDIISKNIKYKYCVDDQSILINQKLKDSDFKVKIPVGTVVTDSTRGISYEADGISDESAPEGLELALEAIVKTAKEEKKKTGGH